MEFRELNYILAIAKYQNISKAAEALYITQPTLSKFLISLEGELGQKLFQRIGNKYIPTYAGKIYLQKAGEILSLKTDLEHELSDIQNSEYDELNIALPSMRCAYMLPVLLPEYRMKHPHVRIQVYEGSSADNRRRLLEGSAMVGFSGMPMECHPSLEYHSLWKEELVIILPKGHPLGDTALALPDYPYPVLDPVFLRDEVFLNLMPYQRTRQIVDAYLNGLNIHLENTISTGSLSAIIDLVAVGYGVSMVFDIPQIHRSQAGGIDYFCLRDRIIHDFAAVTRKNCYLSSSARSFVETMKELHSDGRL